MENFLKLIKEYKTTKNKNAYLLILIEKSKNIEFPIYSLLQLINTISHKPYKVFSSEGWIEEKNDLQQQKKKLEIEKAKLQKERKEFEDNKAGNIYFRSSLLGISVIIIIAVFIFYYVSQNSETISEEELWNKALIENTIASYNFFIRKYPKSKYSVLAKEKKIILKEKSKNNVSLTDSINTLVNEVKKSKNLKVKSNKKQNDKTNNYIEGKVEKEGADYQKALNYYYNAREKFSLKDFKSAHSLIEIALLYDPDNTKYINYKSTIENSLIVQKNKDPFKKEVKNLDTNKDKELLIERPKSRSNQKADKERETKKIKAIVKKEKTEDSFPFTVVNQVPVYPGCKGSNMEIKKCTSNKISKFFNKKYRTSFANKLGLDPGKKRIFVQFYIDKTGKVINAKAKGPHKRLEEEAIRVAQLLPKMAPGKQNSRPVNVKYTLPITLIVE